MSEKERYATIGTWVEVFREEGVKLTESVVRNRLRIAGIVGESGRERSGRPCLHGFFREADIRLIMADVFDSSVLTEKEDGYAYKDGIKYMNINEFVIAHNASGGALRALIEAAQLEPVKGRSKTRLTDYYPEEALLKLWQDYMSLPHANEQDIIKCHEESFCTVHGFSRMLSISESAVRTLVEKHAIEPIEGRDQQNVKRLYYPVKRIRRLLESSPTVPECDADGFIEIEGLRYASLATWCRAKGCSIDVRTIQKKMDAIGIKTLSGIDQRGIRREAHYYSEIDFGKVLQSLTEGVIRLDENQMPEVEGKVYATATKLAGILGISEITVRRLGKRKGIPCLSAKDTFGHSVLVYEIEAFKELILERS